MENFNNIYESINQTSQFMEVATSDLKKALKAILKLFKDYKIKLCFIGGAILPFYGYSRYTTDVDILVDSKDVDKLKDLPIGYIRDLTNGRGKVFKLHDPETRIDVISSGENMGNTTKYKFPSPDSVSNNVDNLPIIDLYDLICFKLVSGIYGKRLKDFGDIQELIKKNNLKKDFMDSQSDDLKLKYIEIWELTNN